MKQMRNLEMYFGNKKCYCFFRKIYHRSYQVTSKKVLQHHQICRPYALISLSTKLAQDGIQSMSHSTESNKFQVHVAKSKNISLIYSVILYNQKFYILKWLDDEW